MQTTNPQSSDPQTPGSPPEKGARSKGCLYVLAMVGAGVVLLALLVLAYAWHRGYLSKLVRGSKLAYEGSSAPGANELRALGCDSAMVMNTEDLGELVGKTGPHNEKYVVTCIIRGDTGPNCDDVAAEYIKAVGNAPGPFVVTVRRTSATAEHCTERYDDDGTKR